MSKNLQVKTENGVVDIPIDAVSVKGKIPLCDFYVRSPTYTTNIVSIQFQTTLAGSQAQVIPITINSATSTTAGVMSASAFNLLNQCNSSIYNIHRQIKSSTSGNHLLTGYETLNLKFSSTSVNHIDIYIYPDTDTPGKISIGNILTNHIIELSHGMVHFEIDIYDNAKGRYVKFTSQPLQHASSIDMFYSFAGDLNISIVAGEVPYGYTSSDAVYNVCWKSF